jgi:hypothetical protein
MHADGMSEPKPWLDRLDWLLIALITLVGMAMNVGKPLTVDDAPHLMHAIHIATHPMTLFTYEYTLSYWPEFGLSVSAPPVASGYLALGVKLLGDDPVLMKIWVTPWVFLLAWMSMRLMKPWAGRWALAGVGGMLLGPIFLPAMNLMLDIPSVALAVTGVTLMRDHLSRGSEAKGISWCLVLGLAAGAMAPLAKYPGGSGPMMMVLMCVLYGRWMLAGVVAVVTAGLFAGWELFIYSIYQHSHVGFQFGVSPSSSKLWFLVMGVLVLTANGAPMFLAMAGMGAGVKRGVAVMLGAVGLGAFLMLAVTDVPLWVYIILTVVGWGFTGWCAVRMVKGVREASKSGGWLGSEDAKVDVFLVGWLVLEVLLELVITPFPAYRRLMGMLLVGGFLLARAGYRMRREPDPALTAMVVAGSLVASLLFWYADRAYAAAAPEALMAFKEFTENPPAEIVAQRKAAGDSSPAGGKAYVFGRWTVSYYAPRMGLKELVLDETVLEPGDRVMMVISGMYVPGTALEPGAFRLDARLNLATEAPVDPTPSYSGYRGMTHATGLGAQFVFLTALKRTVILSNVPVGELENSILRRKVPPSPLAAWVIAEYAMQCEKPFDNAGSRRMVEWGEPFVLRALDHPSAGVRQWTVLLVERNPVLVTAGVREKLVKMRGDEDAGVKGAVERVLGGEK